MTEMNEEWRDAVGYEGLYKVSNKGEVKSLNYNHTRKEKILKPGKNKRGYLSVALFKNGKMKNMKIHRLVCEAFLPNPNNLPQVNHKDENPSNNNVENLEYCDARYNINYGSRNQKVSKAQINDKKKSKAVMCVETGVIYQSIRDIQRKFGYNQSYISKCCRDIYKQAYGYSWQYV